MSTWLALDVHKLSIVAGVLPPAAADPEVVQLENTERAVRRLIAKVGGPEGLAVCYEAGPCGYDLLRLLESMGVACWVIAPALTPVRPGDRVKTDRRDARKLVRLFRAGELTFVNPPSPEQEGLRDLVRCREDLRRARQNARHRVAKQLLRHGRIYREGSGWTKAHMTWVHRQQLDDPLAQRALEHMLAHLEERTIPRGCRLLSYASRRNRKSCIRWCASSTNPTSPRKPIVNQPPRAPHDVLRAAPEGLRNALQYPFFQAAFDRKSRRVGLGMTVESEILDFTSAYEAVPLSELEEALLCIAGTGLTGLNLGDLDPGRGMSTLVQWTTRTWPSSCSNHGTELFYTNDDGLYMLDMFGLVPEPGEVTTLSGMGEDAQVEWIIEMYRRARRELSPGRAPLPTTLPGLFDFNQWNANKPGTTLFVPVTNITLEYINLLFIYLARSYGFSLVDEQHGRRSAGLDAAVASGRLDSARQMGIVELEQRVLSMLVVEQAFICQNINFALQCLGLGGWTFTGYLARFVMGGGDVPGLGFRFHDTKVGASVPVGRDGVFEAFCPPYYSDMHEAVDAFMAVKWAAFEDDVPKPYKEPDRVVSAVPRPHPDTVNLVKDYCQYCIDTYGRFPVHIDPMYQRLTCQAQHVDPDFYAKYYPPGALTPQHTEHFRRWHPEVVEMDGRPPRRD